MHASSVARALRGASGRVAAVGFGVLALLTVAVLVATRSQLAQFEAAIGDLLGLLSQESRPSAGAAVELLTSAAAGLLVPAAAVVVLLVFGWLLLRGPVAYAAHADASRRPVGVLESLRHPGFRSPPLGLRRSLGVLALVLGLALFAAAVAICLTAWTMPQTTTVVRGTTLILVRPTIVLLGAVILGVMLVLVPLQLVLRNALAMAVSGDRQAPEAAALEGTAGWSVAAIVGAVALGLVVAAYLVAAAFAAPIADDYKYFARIDDSGALGYLPEHMRIETGRYASALSISFFYSIFGTAATQVVPALLILGLGAACALAAHHFAPFPRHLRTTGTVLAGIAGAATALAMAPSVFDSYYWLTSSLVYLPPLILAAPSLVAIARSTRAAGRPRLLWRLIAVVLVFVIQGFNEPLAMLTLLLSLAYLAAALPRGRRRELGFRAALAGAALVGLLILVLAPSQANRIRATGTGNAVTALAGAAYGPLQFVASLTWAHFALILGTGVLLGGLLPASARSHLVRLALVGVGMVVLPIPVSSFISCFGTGWAAWRTYGTGGALFGWGMILVIACITALVAGRKGGSRSGRALRGVAAIAICLAAVAVSADGLSLVRAEALRSQVMSARDAAVESGVQHGEQVIDIVPAPILYSPSDARDFEFAAVQSKDWFVPGYREYFDVDRDVHFDYETVPPIGYCLTGDAGSPAVPDCEKLGEDFSNATR